MMLVFVFHAHGRAWEDEYTKERLHQTIARLNEKRPGRPLCPKPKKKKQKQKQNKTKRKPELSLPNLSKGGLQEAKGL
jgi:hypothetical protein